MAPQPKNKQHVNDINHAQKRISELEAENEQLKTYAVWLQKEKSELETKVFDLEVQITKLKAGSAVKGKDLFA